MIEINEFVKRQTKESPFSYFDGTWDELKELVNTYAEDYTPGYKDGVRKVKVPAGGFFTGVIKVDETTELVATFEARREGERPYVVVRGKGDKTPARLAEIIIYRHDVLAENNEQSTEAEWEVVSINASLAFLTVDEPIPPMTMARNMLGLTGGSSATYTAEQFAESIVYWSDKVNVVGAQTP